MEMLIESLGNGILRATHSCLRADPISPAVLLTAATDALAAVRCSVSNRLQVEGAWMEPEMASMREG